jgi:hypothetical protein
MTVKEYSERLSFDCDLIDEYIPNNKFKRIYPLESDDIQMTDNNEKLDEFYEKL